MSGAAIILIVVMLVCLFIGVPISWSLMISSAASVLVSGIPVSILCQRLFTSMDAFTMLAVPLFLVAGDIMAKGSISKRLVDFADSLFGHMRGGMAVVAIVACTIFAALTGSALATTAAIGAIMYPAMTSKKYPKDFTSAVLAIGGTLGPVIPPSVVFIFYAQSTDLSVVDLFMSGVGPGLLSCIGLSFVAVVVSICMKVPKEGHFDGKLALEALKNAFFALLMPLIILGGIYSGIFTATESAGIAVVYGLIVSVLIYRDVKPRELLPMFKSTAKTTANLMILIASANVFGYLIGYFNIPKVLTAFVQTYLCAQPVDLPADLRYHPADLRYVYGSDRGGRYPGSHSGAHGRKLWRGPDPVRLLRRLCALPRYCYAAFRSEHVRGLRHYEGARYACDKTDHPVHSGADLYRVPDRCDPRAFSFPSQYAEVSRRHNSNGIHQNDPRRYCAGGVWRLRFS